MNINPEAEIISEEGINIYEYWKVLIKRKNIFLGIFLVPIFLVIVISLIIPRYYIGENDITIPEFPANVSTSVITAPNIARLIGNIDDRKKGIIFNNNADEIKKAFIVLPPKTTNKLNIIIESEKADIVAQAFEDMSKYINMLPEIKEEYARIHAVIDLQMEATDFRINNLIEVRKTNYAFLKDISDMIKKRKIQWINYNPSDLIRRDGDLSLEIINLRESKKDLMRKKALLLKDNILILGTTSITKHPLNSKIAQWIFITGILSLFAGFFIVFFLDYIDRIRARENK